MTGRDLLTWVSIGALAAAWLGYTIGLLSILYVLLPVLCLAVIFIGELP